MGLNFETVSRMSKKEKGKVTQGSVLLLSGKAEYAKDIVKFLPRYKKFWSSFAEVFYRRCSFLLLARKSSFFGIYARRAERSVIVSPENYCSRFSPPGGFRFRALLLRTLPCEKESRAVIRESVFFYFQFSSVPVSQLEQSSKQFRELLQYGNLYRLSYGRSCASEVYSQNYNRGRNRFHLRN